MNNNEILNIEKSLSDSKISDIEQNLSNFQDPFTRLYSIFGGSNYNNLPKPSDSLKNTQIVVENNYLNNKNEIYDNNISKFERQSLPIFKTGLKRTFSQSSLQYFSLPNKRSKNFNSTFIQSKFQSQSQLQLQPKLQPQLQSQFQPQSQSQLQLQPKLQSQSQFNDQNLLFSNKSNFINNDTLKSLPPLSIMSSQSFSKSNIKSCATNIFDTSDQTIPPLTPVSLDNSLNSNQLLELESLEFKNEIQKDINQS